MSTKPATVTGPHRSDGHRDCGAQGETMVCRTFAAPGRRTHIGHCTLTPGHDGDHVNGLLCSAKETFTDAQVVRYAPRMNMARCLVCQMSWPCRASQHHQHFAMAA